LSICFLNRHFLPVNEAAIPISDRGFLYGDGVFTTIKVTNGVPECYALHVKRLQEQCRLLHIEPPALFIHQVSELIRFNQAENGIWRLKIVITGGNGTELSLVQRSYGTFLMTLQPYMETKKSAHLISYPTQFNTPLAKIKSISYLERLYLNQYAIENAVDEVVVLDSSKNVLETAFSNIFWRVGDLLITPDNTLSLLSGISLQMVLSAAKQRDMQIQLGCKKLEEIPQIAQVFICNSLRGIVPVTKIDAFSFTRDQKWEVEFRSLYNKIIDSSQF
jgi:4-amino-4-deoxychorismate lyase